MGPGLQSGLRIAEGTSKILTSDMISVTDPDSTNADLVITLVPANGNTVMPGHIENERFSGQARNSFTLEDLSNGRVSFVHQVNILFEINGGAHAQSFIPRHYYFIIKMDVKSCLNGTMPLKEMLH